MLGCDEGLVDMFTLLYNHTVGRQHAVASSWTVLCGYHGKHKQSIPTTRSRGAPTAAWGTKSQSHHTAVNTTKEALLKLESCCFIMTGSLCA